MKKLSTGRQRGAQRRRLRSTRLGIVGLCVLICGFVLSAMIGAPSVADTYSGAPIVKNSARLLPSGGGDEDRAPAYTGSIAKRRDSLGTAPNRNTPADQAEHGHADTQRGSCTELELNRQHGSTRARPCGAHTRAETVGSELRTAHRADWQ